MEQKYILINKNILRNKKSRYKNDIYMFGFFFIH